MATSDYTPEMEIGLFRACEMKITQYNNPHLRRNCNNFRVFLVNWGRGTRWHVRFFTKSEHKAVSRMRKKYAI